MSGPCTDAVRMLEWPDACANCGEPIAEHAEAARPSYDSTGVAMWRWFVTAGGVWDTFGGYSLGADRTARIREHLEICAVDVSASHAPEITTVEQFNDTITETTKITASVGALTCECGRLVEVPWTLIGERTFTEAITELIAVTLRAGRNP